jgi:DNA-binding NarL/FixJ family response regulator
MPDATPIEPVKEVYRQVRVLVVQQDPVLAAEVADALEREVDLTVCGIAHNGTDAAWLAQRRGADVVLMDPQLPDMPGPVVAGMIRAASPNSAIVFHGADETENELLDAIDAGATAYLTKSATTEDLVEAVRRASQGEVLIPVALFARAIARRREAVVEVRDHQRLLAEFTPRELDVLNLLAAGLDTATMAQRLGIAPHTVEWHLRHLLEKLHVHSKLQAVVEAARKGLIQI